jgi:hypothetical protein
MTKDEAIREATHRNRSAVGTGATGFWIEVQRSDGEWDVELRTERRSKWERLVDFVVTLLSPP